MIMDILLVEDNDFFMNSNLKYIKEIASKYDVGLNIKKFTYAGDNLARYIQENHIDLALLDIEIGKRNGISVARKIICYHPLVSIIFVTAHGEYIARANKLSPVGFIDKPVDYSKMEKLFYRVVMEKLGKESIESSNARIITFKRHREDVDVKESEILYIKTSDRKLLVKTKDDTIMTNGTICKTKQRLSELFVAVSRDIIVNKREVIGIQKGTITMSNQEILELPVFRHKEIVQKIRS